MIRAFAVLCFLLLAGCTGAPSGPVAAPEPENARSATLPPPSPAQAALVRRGQEVFVQGPCAMCHTIRGTRALGRAGPDLTHLASRRTLAAGTLPNNRGSLAGWILNPQSLKPGTLMPPILLPGEDLTALLSFLETLQ